MSGNRHDDDRVIHVEPDVPRARSGLRVQVAVVAAAIVALGAVSAGLLAPLSAAAPTATGSCSMQDPRDPEGSAVRCPPPVAVADAYTVARGTTLTVPAPGVLANDEGPIRGNGQPVELEAFLVTRHMNPVALDGNGTLTYTPRPGFVGEDTLGYRVRNRTSGREESETAVIRITVTDPTTPPAEVANRVRGGGVLTTAGGQRLSLSVDVRISTTGAASGRVVISGGGTALSSRTITGVRRQGATATVTGTATGASGTTGPFTLTVTDRGNRGDAVTVTFGRTTTTGTLTTGDITLT